MTSAEVIKRLTRAGWALRGVKGSHHVYVHPERPGQSAFRIRAKIWASGWSVNCWLRPAWNKERAMRYPIAIEPGTAETAWGVVVPDLPGCFSAGDTMDEALTNASEAIALWIETALDDDMHVPDPGAVEEHRKNKEFKGWIWALADVDPATISDKAERINITLPARVLRRVDEAARVSNETRSGFLARAAMQAIQQRPRTGKMAQKVKPSRPKTRPAAAKTATAR